MNPHDFSRPAETSDAAENAASEIVHPHYAAPPPSKEVAPEPRIMQALAFVSWIGKLFDPLFHRDKEEMENKAKSP